MATRGLIARKRGLSWEGNYHHWDSYPSGLGKALWDAYRGPFGRDAERMLQVLIDEHPAGWSNIVEADWTKPIGFCDMPRGLSRAELERWSREPKGPQCYCHGDRHEPAWKLTGPEDDTDAEWCYVIDPQERTMEIRCKGYMEFGAVNTWYWHLVGTVDLEAAVEPDWRQLQGW